MPANKIVLNIVDSYFWIFVSVVNRFGEATVRTTDINGACI